MLRLHTALYSELLRNVHVPVTVTIAVCAASHTDNEKASGPENALKGEFAVIYICARILCFVHPSSVSCRYRLALVTWLTQFRKA